MTHKTMPCICIANALSVFVHRVAHIDLGFALRPKNRGTSSLAKRTISTLHPFRSQQITHYKTAAVKIPYTKDGLKDSIPFDYTPSDSMPASPKLRRRPLQFAPLESLHEGGLEITDFAQKDTCTARNLSPKIVTYKALGDSHLQATYSHPEVGPVLNLTPETIDSLAVESLESIPLRANLYAEWMLPGANERRPHSDPTGSTMQYRPAQRASTPTAREDEKRATMITKSSVLKLEHNEHHKHPVADREPWQIQKAALKEKFKEGWNPRKKLSPDALAGIRAIHAQFPEQYTTSVLAEKFAVSPEAIRRILKSRWIPKEEEAIDRQRRWFLRGKKVWGRYAELGLKPPKRWRKLGIGKKDNSAANRKTEKTVTIQSAEDIGQESGESLASMVERIL